MKSPSVKRVNMLILMQPEFEESVKFYESLGLAKKFHMEQKWAEFDLQGVSLGLCPIEAKDLPDRRTGFVLEVDNLQEFYQEFADQVTFLSEPVEAVHGYMVSFKDPGGNIIDLYQPTPEKVKEFAKKAAEKKHEGDCAKGCSC